MTESQAIQLSMDMYHSGFDTAIDKVLEALDRHVDSARSCHEDISRLIALGKDIEQMKGGEHEDSD